MRRVLRAVRFLVLAPLLLAPAGCGNGYQLAPVSGRVTMDNRPLVGAEVAFYPVAGGKDVPYASGTTDEQGRYKLEVLVGGSTTSGAVVGENRVMISLSRLNGPKKIQGRDMAGGGEMLPARYNNASELKCTVPPEGKSDVNFDLKSRE